nr:hypothetical protein BgiMline_004352 [Biomphalaria glabrata]
MLLTCLMSVSCSVELSVREDLLDSNGAQPERSLLTFFKNLILYYPVHKSFFMKKGKKFEPGIKYISSVLL